MPFIVRIECDLRRPGLSRDRQQLGCASRAGDSFEIAGRTNVSSGRGFARSVTVEATEAGWRFFTGKGWGCPYCAATVSMIEARRAYHREYYANHKGRERRAESRERCAQWTK